jgi:prohibitin 2
MNVKGGGRIPAPPPGASALVKVAVLGGAAVYAATQSLYNVEGGHRAIVFNRIQGIKDKVWTPRPTRSLAGPPLSLCIRCAVECWFRRLEGAIGGEMWL